MSAGESVIAVKTVDRIAAVRASQVVVAVRAVDVVARSINDAWSVG